MYPRKYGAAHPGPPLRKGAILPQLVDAKKGAALGGTMKRSAFRSVATTSLRGWNVSAQGPRPGIPPRLLATPFTMS